MGSHYGRTLFHGSTILGAHFQRAALFRRTLTNLGSSYLVCGGRLGFVSPGGSAPAVTFRAFSSDSSVRGLSFSFSTVAFGLTARNDSERASD